MLSVINKVRFAFGYYAIHELYNGCQDRFKALMAGPANDPAAIEKQHKLLLELAGSEVKFLKKLLFDQIDIAVIKEERWLPGGHAMIFRQSNMAVPVVVELDAADVIGLDPERVYFTPDRGEIDFSKVDLSSSFQKIPSVLFEPAAKLYAAVIKKSRRVRESVRNGKFYYL